MTAAAHAVLADKPAPCLARRPIFTKDEKVMGYEVLFDGLSGAECSPDREQAPSGIVEALQSVGLDVMCGGFPAFIHCTHDMLVQDALAALPAKDVVVEIGQDMTVSAPVMEACQRLKKKGYKIAIDSFWMGDDREPLVQFADFIRVDASRRGAESLAKITAAYKGKPCRMVAQNVDTRAQYKNAEKAGFGLFQGYFFHHPEQMRVRQIPANQSSKLRLLQAISAPELDFKLLENLIRQDASLCYRLMRYLNSPVLGFAVPIQSVRQAISLLGAQAITRWIRTATALSLGQPKCAELVNASLVRARFCELIAPRVDHGSVDLFLVGMFSLMDAILETPLQVLLDGLAFDPHAKGLLLAMKNGGGTRLSPICDLMVAREKGDWELVTTHAEKLGLSRVFVNRAYIEAMEWAQQMTRTAELHGNVGR